ncbi:hypothetical protein, partial [Myxococcus sp. AB025B]|uniref:hypothetical protein n=1 Tax=Myxococcus sp. AB025B TaxID=2562794 RepID=UPI001890EEDD
EVLASRLACKLVREREAYPYVRELQIGIATGHAYFGDMGSPCPRASSGACCRWRWPGCSSRWATW